MRVMIPANLYARRITDGNVQGEEPKVTLPSLLTETLETTHIGDLHT